MARAKIVTDQDGNYFGVEILCRACRWPDGYFGSHTMNTDWIPEGMKRSSGAWSTQWQFNGNLNLPVFSPSLLCTTTRGEARAVHICHSFIGCNGAQPGQIIYLPDCTHELAGRTVDLEEFPDGTGGS